MRVVIPIDESKFSDLALESVKLRTWPADTIFYVCSIVPDGSFMRYIDPHYLPAAEKAAQEMMNYTRAVLDRKVEELQWSFPKHPVSSHVEFGPVAERIIDYAVESEADLIVMGSHGRRGVSRYALGSVAESVVGYAPCSVEVIKLAGANATNGGSGTGVDAQSVLNEKRFLICYDGSANARAALAWVAQGHWDCDQEFVLLTVLAPPDEPMEPATIRRRKGLVREKAGVIWAAERMLESASDSLRANPEIKSVEYKVCEGCVVDTILEFAEQLKVDVIILGAHATLTPSENPMLGSVARRVAGLAACTVRVVRAKYLSEQSSDEPAPLTVAKDGGDGTIKPVDAAQSSWQEPVQNAEKESEPEKEPKLLVGRKLLAAPKSDKRDKV